jgi:uncharacterized protein (DUF362 family)
MSSNQSWRLDRREFLKLTAAGALGAAAGSLPLPRVSEAAAGHGQVVCVKGAKVATESGLDGEVVGKMIEKGLCAFTGKPSVAAAWKEFVSPKDIIGLKINCLGGHMIPTHPVFTQAVIKSLVAAGFDENNIIVWDRFGTHMKEGGYELKSGTGVQYLASEAVPEAVGYDNEVPYQPDRAVPGPSRGKKGGGPSCVAKILTQKITAMINLPVLKDHRGAGITLSLKNIAFGITNNSGPWHENHGDPMIPEVCSMKVVKDKLRLNILDALEACYDGGPRPKSADLLWKPEMIYVATDMVAMDTVGAQVIDAKRKEKGLKPAMLIATHIATAAKMKLGTNLKSAIKVENVNV